MILMFLVMFLPIIGLPVFWILPFGQAFPIYLFFLFLFAGMMWVMRGAMKQPRMTGPDCLIGKTAEMVSGSSMGYGPPFMVRVLGGEIWSARCDEPLEAGDAVIIVSVQGNSVFVERKNKPDVIPDARS